jgi:hypothetical protein
MDEQSDQAILPSPHASLGAPSNYKLAIGYWPGGGLNTAKTLSEFVIHDSKNTASSGFRLSSAIAPARQNQLSSS